jgi:hypothetical protein
MARVVRIDNREWIGYFVEFYGPLDPGAQGSRRRFCPDLPVAPGPARNGNR